MISENEFNILFQKCQKLPPAKGNYLVNDYIENLMLTVLDYQMHETSIKKAIGHYKTHRLPLLFSLSERRFNKASESVRAIE